MPATIRAIGVWDTVGSLGIPVEDPTDRKRVDVFAFADTRLSTSVERGIQALAIDEQRDDFQPTLWDPRDGVEQRWFCGAHADVGGGYPSQEFSGVSLDWMIGRLRDAGLVVSTQYAETGQFPFGPFHTPYLQDPFNLRPHSPRDIPEGTLFHPSVQSRLDGQTSYAPANLSSYLTGRKLRADLVAE